VTWYDRVDSKTGEWRVKLKDQELVYQIIYELMCDHDAALLEMARVRRWEHVVRNMPGRKSGA
jgi:hypothetical protein